MKLHTTKSPQKIHKILSGRCNCFLIESQNRHLLVDTGRENRWKTLAKRLAQLGVTHESLVGVILTHSHFDHAENAAHVKEKYKTAIIIHRSEADYLRRGENPAIKGSTFVTKLMTDMINPQWLLHHLRYKPVEPDILVDEKYDLHDLGFNGYIIHTPGHSPGSMSVIIDNKIALVGDAMFGIFPGSVFPPFAENIELMIKSWKKLLDTGCSTYLPAHGIERSREVLYRQYEIYNLESKHDNMRRTSKWTLLLTKL